MYVEKHNGIAASTKDYYQAGIEYLMKQPIADMRLHMIQKEDDQPLQRRALTQSFGEVRRAGKLPKGTVLYLARHTYATDIMQETGNIFVTKEIMGHSSTWKVSASSARWNG